MKNTTSISLFRSRRSGRIMLFALTAASLLYAAACAPPTPKKNPLTGPWEYAVGDLNDDVRIAERYRYSALKQLTGLEKLVPQGQGAVWLKKKFIVPPEMEHEKLSLLLGTIIPADETYLNGECVGGYGSFPRPGVNFFSDWNRFRKYDINASLLKKGDNILLIKIYVSYEGSVNGTIALGERSAIHRIYVFQDFIRYNINMIITGIMLFTAGLLFMIYLKRPIQRENLHLAVTCVLFSFFNLNFFITRIPGGWDEKIPYFLFQKIVFGLPCFSLLFLINFVHIFLKVDEGRFIRTAKYAATVVPGIVIFLMPDYRSIVLYGKQVLTASAGSAMLYAFILSLVMSVRRNSNARAFLIGFTPVIGCILHDMVAHVLYHRDDIIYLSGFGISSYILFIAVILANSLVNYYKQVKVLNDELALTIAEQLKVENELLFEKEQLVVTIDSIAEAVIATDIEGRVLLLNSIAEELCGASLQEIVGKPLPAELTLRNRKISRMFQEIFNNIHESGRKLDIGMRKIGRDSDHDKKYLLGSGAPIRNRSGTVMGYVFILRDMTEDIKLQNEILKVKKLESIGILAGGIAHDFNNILTSILGNVNLAKLMMERGSDTAQLIGEAENAIIRAQGLTRQLLTFSKGGAPVKQVVSIQEVIRDSADFMLRGSNVKCTFHFHDDLRPVNIDVGQFSQVVQNLVINAIQAMPEGGDLSIEIENCTLTGTELLPLRPGDYIRIAIIDTGSGIDPRHLSKIFDPYFTTKDGGSGLGLASSFSIIKKHEGHIEAESAPGRGSCFNIYLPSTQDSLRKDRRDGDSITPATGSVLLLDDDENVGATVKKMLEHLGMNVDLTSNGFDTIELYKSRYAAGAAFDLVILDLTIPGGIGGKEVLEELMKINPWVSAIVSSGYSTDSVMSNYERYGFKGVISKPYRLEELSRVINRILSEE